MGLTSALLAIGAGVIVASTVDVPDAPTRPLMAALHERLQAGHRPALALAGARGSLTATTRPRRSRATPSCASAQADGIGSIRARPARSQWGPFLPTLHGRSSHMPFGNRISRLCLLALVTGAIAAPAASAMPYPPVHETGSVTAQDLRGEGSRPDTAGAALDLRGEGFPARYRRRRARSPRRRRQAGHRRRRARSPQRGRARLLGLRRAAVGPGARQGGRHRRHRRRRRRRARRPDHRRHARARCALAALALARGPRVAH